MMGMQSLKCPMFLAAKTDTNLSTNLDVFLNCFHTLDLTKELSALRHAIPEQNVTCC